MLEYFYPMHTPHNNMIKVFRAENKQSPQGMADTFSISYNTRAGCNTYVNSPARSYSQPRILKGLQRDYFHHSEKLCRMLAWKDLMLLLKHLVIDDPIPCLFPNALAAMHKGHWHHDCILVS